LDAVDELRSLVPEGSSMAQFATRWFLMLKRLAWRFPVQRIPGKPRKMQLLRTYLIWTPKPWKKSRQFTKNIFEKKSISAGSNINIGLPFAP